jgi:hypothetical protein
MNGSECSHSKTFKYRHVRSSSRRFSERGSGTAPYGPPKTSTPRGVREFGFSSDTEVLLGSPACQSRNGPAAPADPDPDAPERSALRLEPIRGSLDHLSGANLTALAHCPLVAYPLARGPLVRYPLVAYPLARAHWFTTRWLPTRWLVPTGSLPAGPLRTGSQPGGSLSVGVLPDGSLPGGALSACPLLGCALPSCALPAADRWTCGFRYLVSMYNAITTIS